MFVNNRENTGKNLSLSQQADSQACIMASVTTELSSLLSLQPEEYGQEAMEGQGEAMLDPEGETYDESQQVIRIQGATTSPCMSQIRL